MTKLAELRFNECVGKRHKALEALALFAYDNGMKPEDVDCEEQHLDGEVRFLCRVGDGPEFGLGYYI